MAYVPPHIRTLGTTGSSTEVPSPPPSASTPRNRDIQSNNDGSLYTRDEVHHHFWPDYDKDVHSRHTSGTLNSSAEHPKSIQYIILYHGANPRWKSNKIIFAKTNIRLLGIDVDKWKVESAEDLSTASNHLTSVSPEHVTPPPEPVLVFEQIRRTQTGRSYCFNGFYQIRNLDHLAPRSEALAKMLVQKWGSNPVLTARNKGTFWGKTPPAERDPVRWEESLRVPWAVIKFEKMSDETIKELGLVPPQIEVCEDEEEEVQSSADRRGSKGENIDQGKSVKEMLAELRMGDGERKESKEDTEEKAESHQNLDEGYEDQ